MEYKDCVIRYGTYSNGYVIYDSSSNFLGFASTIEEAQDRIDSRFNK